MSGTWTEDGKLKRRESSGSSSSSGHGHGHGRKGSVVPRSLIISPNLDALLEHEERKRAALLQSEPRTPETCSQSQSPEHSEIPSGLPPPPRRLRGSRVPTSPLAETAQRRASIGGAIGNSSSMSNPYINPAPTLEEVLQLKEEDGSKEAAQPRSPSQSATGPEKIQEAACAAPGKAFGTQLNLFRVRSAKGRLVKKQKENESLQTNMQEGWRRRPLISHGQRASLSSIESASTHGPASTLEHEPRISVSSTVYPASSAHSHPQSLYNEPAAYDRASFIEIVSPTHPEFELPRVSPDGNTDPPLSPIQFSGPSPSERSFAIDMPSSNSPKPPIPTTPKPMFIRPQLKASPRGSPTRYTHTPLPPTTNFLDVDERADLVRKSRKLTRVFGQTPGGDAIVQSDARMDDADRPRSKLRPRPDSFVLSNHRRHSMPPTPDDVSFLSIVSPRIEPPSPSRGSSKSSDHHQIRPGSPTSFIDLSDDETPASAARSSGTRPAQKASRRSSSPTNQSVDTMSILSVDDRLEDERRRKRERLAKLHRFLGSRVPANLVLGIDDLEASLPPAQDSPASKPGTPEGDDSTRRAWLRRRRSRSVTAPPSRWSEDIDRVKEELDDAEKALNVRRAQKMEKVFGVAPPLTLYHTRHCPSPSTLPPAKSLPPVPTISPLINDLPTLTQTQTLDRESPSRFAYPTGKTKAKKNGRPGTSESNKQLLPSGYEHTGFDDRLGPTPLPLDARHSLIYTHYQHSLNSLNDILDRDDRESLAELHQYLNNTELPSPTPAAAEDDLTALRLDRERRLSVASTIKSERRRSLPARTSMLSLASVSSDLSALSGISTPKAEITTFQARRRRAAKLTQFFGVNYRELVNDVLESIESGVEHEQRRGTLRAEEVEDLLSRLRNLKTKRQGLF